MALINPPSIFQVFQYSQTKSISNTDPSQPSDPSKDLRMYVIVAPTYNSSKVTCCPIQDVGNRVSLTEVELTPHNYPGFINKVSKILCHEIYTLQAQYFIKHVGAMGRAEQDKIKLAIKTYFRLS